LPADHSDPLDALAPPDLFRKVGSVVEELARLEQVERGRVRQVPIHHEMRRVIQQRREISILIKPENRRNVIVPRCPARQCRCSVPQILHGTSDLHTYHSFIGLKGTRLWEYASRRKEESLGNARCHRDPHSSLVVFAGGWERLWRAPNTVRNGNRPWDSVLRALNGIG
jgi:hypothetical protein